jgi:hypothetical protein
MFGVLGIGRSLRSARQRVSRRVPTNQTGNVAAADAKISIGPCSSAPLAHLRCSRLIAVMSSVRFYPETMLGAHRL